jgi:hypothetical protein
MGWQVRYLHIIYKVIFDVYDARLILSDFKFCCQGVAKLS